MNLSYKKRFDLVKSTLREILFNEDESIKEVVDRMGLKKYLKLYETIDFEKVKISDLDLLTEEVINGSIEKKFLLSSVINHENNFSSQYEDYLNESNPIYMKCLDLLKRLKNGHSYAKSIRLLRMPNALSKKIRDNGLVNIGDQINPRYKLIIRDSLIPTLIKVSIMEAFMPDHPDLEKLKGMLPPCDISESSNLYNRSLTFVNKLKSSNSIYEAYKESGLVSSQFTENMVKLMFINVGSLTHPSYKLKVTEDEIGKLIKEAYISIFRPNNNSQVTLNFNPIEISTEPKPKLIKFNEANNSTKSYRIECEINQFTRNLERLKDLVKPLNLKISYSNGFMEVTFDESPMSKLYEWLIEMKAV